MPFNSDEDEVPIAIPVILWMAFAYVLCLVLLLGIGWIGYSIGQALQFLKRLYFGAFPLKRLHREVANKDGTIDLFWT